MSERRATFVRNLRARWRFVWIVTASFRAEILFAALTILLSGICINRWHPERPEIEKALHAGLALLTLQQELSFPEPPPGASMTAGIRLLQLLWFVLPVVGVTVVAETLVRLGVTVFNRQQGREEWQVAVAETLRDHTIVIGFGRIGYRVVGQLAPRDSRIVVVEHQPKDEFTHLLTKYEIPLIRGDARSDEVLGKANVKRAKTILCLTNDDLVNLAAGLNARELNPSIKVIVRMFDDNLATRIERAFDFQAVFSTSALAAPSFAAAVWNPKILSSMSIGDEHLHLARFTVAGGSPLLGLTIAQVEARHSVNVLLHQREGHRDLLPAAGNVLGAQDSLYLVAPLEGVDGFDRLAGGARTSSRSGRWRGPDQDTRSAYNRRLEEFYERVGDRIEDGDHYQSRAKERALVLADVRPGQRVLEVGIGSGDLVGRIAGRLGNDGQVIGLDLSEALLRRARPRLAPSRAPLVRANALRLPFREETFDRILATYLLDRLEEEDVLLALSEMRRVARGGALLVFAGLTERGASASGRLVARAYSFARRIQPLWTGGGRPLDLEPLARRAGLRVVAREVIEQAGRASEVVCCSR